MTDRATNEPSELRAGLTWEWEREFADYPAPTWSLTYYFKRMGGTDKFSIAASASGTKHVVDVAPATNASYVADDYTWVAVISDGTDKFEADRGTLKLLPRYDLDAALDDRTHAKKMLEAIETALEAFATNATIKEYTIGSRSMTKQDIPELLSMRDYYRNQVRAEQLAENARNGKEGGKLVVRF